MRERQNLNPRRVQLNARQSDNLTILFARTMQLQAASGIDLSVTSGVRDLAHHIEIYRKKNEKRKAQGLQPVRIPLSSQHLYGAAADFWDGARKLQEWILNHVSEVEKIGLWFEDFSETPTWVHAQIYPPKSGKRFFKP